MFTAPLDNSHIAGEWQGIGRPGAHPSTFSHVLLLQRDPDLPKTGVFNGCNYTMSDGSQLKLRPAPAASVGQFAPLIDITNLEHDGDNWLYCSGPDPQQCRFVLLDAAAPTH